MNDDEGELSAAAETCGSDPIEVPAYVSPIAVAFNLEGVDSLNMSAETIANIFNGTITKWNDDAIAARQRRASSCPTPRSRSIHRSDDSGTTTNFTDYLFKASDGAWTDRGRRPVARGRRRPGPRGHLRRDRWHHRHRRRDRLRRRQRGQGHRPRRGLDRAWVTASTRRPPRARPWFVAGSPRAEGRTDVDMAIDIDRTITDEGAYPLLLTSYLIACQSYDDEATADRGQGLPRLRRVHRGSAGRS